MIIYKDILTKLKEAGYTTTRLRREKILGESTLTKLRHNKPISTDTLGPICELTGRPVENLIEYSNNAQKV